jgi:hypothetical protein
LHGEFIHGAIAILSSSGAFAWRRAHLERRGAPDFLQMFSRKRNNMVSEPKVA